MMNSHTTTIDLCGEEYDAEVSYEFSPGSKYPIIYGVQVVKQTCKKGGYFYTESGSFQSGPAFVNVSITDLLDAKQIAVFADAIIAVELMMRVDAIIDQAKAKADCIDRWIFTQENGFCANYPADMREEAA